MKISDLELIKTKEGKQEFTWYYKIDTPEFNCLKVSIYYELGGMNYFNSTVRERGYYGSLTPISLTPTSEISSLFTGGYVMLEPTGRYNQKRLDELKNTVNEALEPYLAALMSKIKGVKVNRIRG